MIERNENQALLNELAEIFMQLLQHLGTRSEMFEVYWVKEFIAKNNIQIDVDACMEDLTNLGITFEDNDNSEFNNKNFCLVVARHILNNNTITETNIDSFNNDIQRYVDKTNPIVVMLYCVIDGVELADRQHQFFSKQGINIILIQPYIGMHHPILKQPENINGIILPGGPNVPNDNNDIRKKVEIALIEYAAQNKIPLLGICRGHQVIGQYYGGEIDNINSKTTDKHEGPEAIVVKNKSGSFLYERLQKKYDKKSTNPNDLTKNSDESLTYRSMCLHEQGVFFFKNRSNKNLVKIVAKSQNCKMIPEALEIDNGRVMTYQHHHESLVDNEQQNSDSDAGKVAKAVLNVFTKRVKNDCAQKNVVALNHLSDASSEVILKPF